MTIHEGLMFAVGNRPLVDVPGEEIRATLNGWIDLRIERLTCRLQRFFTDDDGDVRRDACLIDRAIRRDGTVQTAVRFQERSTVSVCAVTALNPSEGYRKIIQAGDHVGVSCAKVILAEKDTNVGPVPNIEGGLLRPGGC